MTSYLKKLTAVLLAAVLIICGAPAVSAEDLLFRGSISADSGLNAGGISIEVYGSRERYSKNGLKRYEHYYIKTVTTDSTGNFSFTRPAGKTLLRVDLSTLPRGTGVSAMTRLVDKKCDDPFRLSRIDNITISASGDGNVYKVNLNAKDGSPLFAEYDTTESVSASFRDVTYDTLNYVELYRTVNVNAGGVRGSDTFKLDISSCTVNGKLNRLMDYGIIDEYTRQEIIDAYNIDTATPDDLRPEFFDERTFTAGGFMLHSERSTQDVELYESILADIVNVYFTKYGFLEPYHEFVNGSSTLREKYFHIYLVDPDAIRIDSEVAPKNVVGKTMKADPTNVTKGCYIVLSPNEPEDFRTTLSHEIFHSIIYRYLGKDCATWFKEAFSNYGAMLCLNGAVTSMKKQMSHYLNSPGYTLSDSSSYRNRQYGLTLIPLYIHNKLGGVKTIKNILKAYANSNNAFKAIDKGLKKTNRSYSFSSMFAGFKDLNAFTTFYKIPDVSSGVVPIGVGKDAARTIISSFVTADTVSTPQMTLAGNSAAYFEFRSPDNGRGNLTVTVETLDGVSDASYNLIVKGRSITIPARRSSSAKFVTFELTDFGGKYDTAVLTAGDTALLAKNEVSFRAVAYYEPS